MKYAKQFMMIALVCFIGELLHFVIPLPVPASIYGMVTMFLLLEFRIVKLSQVEDTAEFFLAIMPLLFIEPNVKLMTVMGAIKGELLQILVMIVVSTIVVTSVTGITAQAVIRFQKKRQKKGGKGK